MHTGKEAGKGTMNGEGKGKVNVRKGECNREWKREKGKGKRNGKGIDNVREYEALLSWCR